MAQPNQTILVIEREESTLKLFQVILQRYGYLVIAHLRSNNAIDLNFIENNTLDLIIFDLVLSEQAADMDFIEALASNHNTKDIPLIVTSNDFYQTTNVLMCDFNLGIGQEIFTLPKPFPLKLLLELIVLGLGRKVADV